MIEFLVVVLLLLGNAFFVAGEFSLIASRRTVLEPLAPARRWPGWRCARWARSP